MDRIVISVTSLRKDNWVTIYQFIRSILIGDTLESKTNVFHKIIEIATVSLEKNIVKAIDVYKLDDTIIKESDLDSLTWDTAFSLIYEKEDDTEDFTELVPFILLQEEFKKRISLGIDIEKLDLEKQGNYAFRCSDFFILYKDMAPKHGYNSIYFINEKKKNKSGKIVPFSSNHITSLKGKGKKKYKGDSIPNATNGDNYKSKGNKENERNTSRRFLPLIFISQDNYHSIFGISKKKIKEDPEELVFIKNSIRKMLADFDEKAKKKLNLNTDLDSDQTESFFGQWLECGYFHSFEDNEKNELEKVKIEETKKTIQIIKNNVYELVQNIIFHAGKKGMLYCVFEKKKNIPQTFNKLLPDYNTYDDDFRFLRIGIYDFSKNGIVDTFIGNMNINKDDMPSLSDFFKIESIITTKLSRPDLRYAAHLGIKTFVKTIIKHKGFFSVESNGINIVGNYKTQIKTTVEDNTVKLTTENKTVFANGTHYEIVFPVRPYESNEKTNIPVQRRSLLADNFSKILNSINSGKPLQSIELPVDRIEKIVSSQSKEEQKENIKNVGLSLIHDKKGENELVINMSNHSYDFNVIIKLLSFIQLTASESYEKIILINAKNELIDRFCELIESLITEDDEYTIWSYDHAIIIFSEELRAQIIWGKYRSEFEYINSELRKLYWFNSLAIIPKIINDHLLIDNYSNFDKETKSKAESFILPYDIIINNSNNQSIFEQFLNRLLRRRIISEKLGFLVNHDNTYIGNKIIVRNYYEADMMFQNNFFTERFAYIISNNLHQALEQQKGHHDKHLVIIGYKHYSELLLKAIKRAFIKGKDTGEVKVHLVIANFDNKTNDYNNYFNFDIDGCGWIIKKDILNSPYLFHFATIVPIGSTLSTNDKIIAFFNYWFEKESHKKSTFDFIYNHCVIVVRDNTGSVVSSLEKERKWQENGIDLSQRVISTNYGNAKNVHYTVQVAYVGEKQKKTNWVKRLNNDISFPQNWWEEDYVNFTENSSINSQNLMGFPRADIVEKTRHYQELLRLFKLKDFIIKGHIDVFNSHHKFYVDTESFVKSEPNELTEWLSGLKKDYEEAKIFDQDKVNILITPCAESESDFIYAINDIIFDNKAFIVYLDIKNWRNNIVHKLSFLYGLPSYSVRYHYVDQALLTGETYFKTKSYLFSILGSNLSVDFSSIITIANRLHFTKNIEIKKDVKNKLFAYISLYYPSIKTDEQRCELCKLNDYYEWLSSRTVINSCLGIIRKNKEKLTIIHKENIVPNSNKLSKRNFLRLALTHELFYIISSIAKKEQINENNYERVKGEIIKELDSIYTQLSENQTDDDKSINSIINSWFDNGAFKSNKELNDFYHRKLITDKKISFLKVISSPPLSRYIIIRQYAHKLLLFELKKIIDKTTYDYDDIKVVKSILKSLSFLKSNALVRKNVIIGIWKVLGIVINNLEIEKKKINGYTQKSISHLLYEIKEEIQKTKYEFNGNLFNNEYYSYYEKLKILHAQKKQVKDFRMELEYDLASMIKNEIIKDFSMDVQFFIKNAIVKDEAKATFLGELLRQGMEITNFVKLRISNTVLSLNNQESDNEFFNYFKGNKDIEKEYIHFLVWIFYDNTTIIRKTLENFSKEIIKDETVYNWFFDKRDNESTIKDTDEIINNITNIIRFFKRKVKSEYYYSSFKPYLYNKDQFNFIEKLIYITHAKLKLEDITNYQNKTNIETDTKDLLKVFTKIMGADAAFWTMKKQNKMTGGTKDKKSYFISQFGLDNCKKISEGILTKDFYTNTFCIYKGRRRFPFAIKYNLDSKYAEKKIKKTSSLVIFYILNNDESIKKRHSTSSELSEDIVASITLLYNEDNILMNNEDNKLTESDIEKNFRIYIQESGRLMLLLKNEIERYVIGYLIKDKALDLWEQKFWSARRFEKIYAQNAHIFNSVYDEMEEFEKLEDNIIIKFSKTWYHLTNETINYLYSNIEQNSNNSRHYLKISSLYILDSNNTIGKTFNKKFMLILSRLLETRWEYIPEEPANNSLKNKIIINGYDINNFKMDEMLSSSKISCNKHLIRTFVVQCLNNSLGSTNSEHGHRADEEIKCVYISITSTYITIEDSCLNVNPCFSKDEMDRTIKEFEVKKTYIEDMKCDEYSSTTLTSLQGLVNYMRNKSYNYSCKFGFTENNNFKITINYN